MCAIMIVVDERKRKKLNKTGCSAVGSALGSGPRGRGFKSRHSDHEKK